MSDGAGKRKQGPGGNGPATKKSKGGSGGKWQTPHQKARKTEQTELGRTLEVNDAGIWVTYARGMKGKAITEFKNLCNEYGESLFGVKPPNEDGDNDEDDEDAGDIEASIEKELASMAQPKPKTKQTFTPIGTGLDCVFFMKTVKPVEPLKLVTKACQDAKDCPDPMQRKTKYINRLTPIFDTDKATDKGIERVARTVMESHFELKSESGEDASAEPATSEQDCEGPAACTYAIRYNIRNHTAFKSSEVIKKIADLVSPKHKVNLTSPDKVVLVEIFQVSGPSSRVLDLSRWHVAN
ncbi:hypothetical protein FOWG_05768 [Fusarium oxysporum f. sp. lycopersici MN25]|nr:hypothetical protein FOWG_05768 [Fusarium oxysporum f. sp. lycopersici MN25]